MAIYIIYPLTTLVIGFLLRDMYICIYTLYILTTFCNTGKQICHEYAVCPTICLPVTNTADVNVKYYDKIPCLK